MRTKDRFTVWDRPHGTKGWRRFETATSVTRAGKLATGCLEAGLDVAITIGVRPDGARALDTGPNHDGRPMFLLVEGPREADPVVTTAVVDTCELGWAIDTLPRDIRWWLRATSHWHLASFYAVGPKDLYWRTVVAKTPWMTKGGHHAR